MSGFQNEDLGNGWPAQAPGDGWDTCLMCGADLEGTCPGVRLSDRVCFWVCSDRCATDLLLKRADFLGRSHQRLLGLIPMGGEDTEN